MPAAQGTMEPRPLRMFVCGTVMMREAPPYLSRRVWVVLRPLLLTMNRRASHALLREEARPDRREGLDRFLFPRRVCSLLRVSRSRSSLAMEAPMMALRYGAWTLPPSGRLTRSASSGSSSWRPLSSISGALPEPAVPSRHRGAPSSLASVNCVLNLGPTANWNVRHRAGPARHVTVNV